MGDDYLLAYSSIGITKIKVVRHETQLATPSSVKGWLSKTISPVPYVISPHTLAMSNTA